MSKAKWFRFYSEALDDPKVQNLDGDTFKAWVNILCLAAKNNGVLPPMADIAFALRIDNIAAVSLVDRLLIATLIDKRKGGSIGHTIAPHGWEKRQYKSDSSTERVKRFRSVSETVNETAPDTDTEQIDSLAKAKAKNVDSDKVFWDGSKAYLADHGKPNGGSLIGKWCRDHGKGKTAEAITAAQLERVVDPVSFIEKILRREGAGVDWGPC